MRKVEFMQLCGHVVVKTSDFRLPTSDFRLLQDKPDPAYLLNLAFMQY